MTHEEMLAFGERIATGIVRANLDSTTEPELARLLVLVAHQVMLMGEVFGEDAGLDVEALHREATDQAGPWHDRILAMATAAPQG